MYISIYIDMYFFFKRGGGATRPIGSVSTFRFSRFVLILQKSHWNCTSSHEKHIMGWYDFLVSCSFSYSFIYQNHCAWMKCCEAIRAMRAMRTSSFSKCFFVFTSSNGKIKVWHLDGINNKYTSMHTFQKSWHQPPGLLASTSGVFYVGCFNPLLEKHEIDTSPENKSLTQFLGKSWWISMFFFPKSPKKLRQKKHPGKRFHWVSTTGSGPSNRMVFTANVWSLLARANLGGLSDGWIPRFYAISLDGKIGWLLHKLVYLWEP